MTRNRLLVLLAAVTGVGPLAMHAMVPVLPEIAKEFNVPIPNVQMMITLALVGMALATLLIGTVSDALGRRPVLLFALAITCFGSVVAGMAPTIEVAIAGRFVQASAGVAGIVLARAIATDKFTPVIAGSFVAKLTAVMVIMPMLAPSIGGELSLITGWRGVFFLVAILTAVLWGWALLRLPETNTDKHGELGLRALGQGLIYSAQSREFWRYSILAIFLMASFFYFVGAAPFVMDEAFGFEPNIYGRYFLSTSVFYLAGNLIAAQFLSRIGLFRIILLAGFFNVICIGTVVLIAALGGNTPLLLFLPAGFSGLGAGISAPPCLAAAVAARSERAGAASSLVGFCQFAVASLAAYVAAFVDHSTIFPTVLGFWILMLFGFGGWLLLRRPNLEIA